MEGFLEEEGLELGLKGLVNLDGGGKVPREMTGFWEAKSSRC